MTHRAISPLDGRYTSKVAPLQDYVSEWALMKYRVWIEIRWLITMSEQVEITHVRSFTADEVNLLKSLVDNFNNQSADEIKTFERTTNHDVKAVEYYIKQKIGSTSLVDVSESVHFACTSEDINNLAYATMFRNAIQLVWIPKAQAILNQLEKMSQSLAGVPMLSRTHGQSATPTTVGKELYVFVYRLKRQLKQIQAQEYLGKFNGAVGSYNAHAIAYPDSDWDNIARTFVESLDLTHNPLTTQIEPHDYLAELSHKLMRFNTILLDLCRDMWAYISLAYFKQRVVAGETGSSTMPHKVNPIDFENAEANVGLSNAILDHLANKLPVSRLQRDLSDSSVLRNVGVGVAHSYLSLLSLEKGLSKVVVNRDVLESDLNNAWEVIGEAVQTVLRKHRITNAYETLKDLTRGTTITQNTLQDFITALDIPDTDKQRLLDLTPSTYVGQAEALVNSHLQPCTKHSISKSVENQN